MSATDDELVDDDTTTIASQLYDSEDDSAHHAIHRSGGDVVSKRIGGTRLSKSVSDGEFMGKALLLASTDTESAKLQNGEKALTVSDGMNRGGSASSPTRKLNGELRAGSPSQTQRALISGFRASSPPGSRMRNNLIRERIKPKLDRMAIKLPKFMPRAAVIQVGIVDTLITTILKSF